MISETDIHHATILIVDDEESNVDLLKSLLSSAGYTNIDSILDPSQAYELHSRNHYDLILLDMKMPGMNGFQVLEALKEIETDGYLSVLVITANADCKLQALQAGAKDFISKPFDIAEIIARVRNLLEVRLLHQKACRYAKAQEFMALHDPLTGLANRRLLVERTSQAIIQAKRNRNTMGVLYLDLDGFKEINNTYGHDGGDVLLKLVAERLQNLVRQEDTVARLGGDEFVVVMPHISGAHGAELAAGKIIKALSYSYDIEVSEVTVSASGGISLYPYNGKNVGALLKNADIALLDAKRAEKNTFRASDRAD